MSLSPREQPAVARRRVDSPLPRRSSGSAGAAASSASAAGPTGSSDLSGPSGSAGAAGPSGAAGSAGAVGAFGLRPVPREVVLECIELAALGETRQLNVAAPGSSTLPLLLEQLAREGVNVRHIG